VWCSAAQVQAELAVAPVKYVVWSNDMQYVALISKHCTAQSAMPVVGRAASAHIAAHSLVIGRALPPAITLATKNLEQLAVLHETIRIKSGAWDDTGVFVYTTLNHLKYALLSGYVRVVCTPRFPRGG